jgi:hypothetical protein
MMCLWASYKKKYKKYIFFASLYSKSDPEMDPDPDADLLVRGTYPRIRIRSKMTRFREFGETGSTLTQRIRTDSGVQKMAPT